ncbi:helix-turn-helix transcriptional regulator [Gordonia sp. CPCC 205515]|uniref:helix-turn-helix domain-containing protein n=1 Tax=Gordonia sp. CPCC 205515 TaxID=3140791 RepID=UPI003AF33430
MPARERGSLDWGTYGDSFGHRLAKIRRLRHLSQQELAVRCEMHHNQISNLERNTSNRDPYIADPKLSTIYRLARALDVPPSLLLPDLNRRVQRQSPEQATNRSLSQVEAELERLVRDLGAD